ncbi:MAG TPA: tail fiber domain-containing protein [Rhizomicrobium sp.]
MKKSTAYAAPDQVAYFDDISTDAYTDIHEIARFGRSNFGGTSASASILATGYDLSGYFSSNLMTSSGLLTRDYATRSGGYLAISNSASTGARSSFQFGGVDQGGASYVSMNIDSGGNVGIDTVSPTLTLYVNGTSGGTSAWTNTSDARLKKNIVPISGALDLIEALQGVRFDWRQPDERSVGKALNLPAGERQIGFIAQDVEKVLPEAISQAKGREALLGVEESKVVPVLVEAVKQLAAANRSQSAQIEKLEQRISLLERKNATSTADVQSPR